VAFLISAALIIVTVFPESRKIERIGTIFDEITFGLRAYMKTPRLRGLVTLYLAVSAASAMIIVNTVVYVRETLGGSESDVAIALAAAGGGSMLAARGLPKILDRVPDRPVMLLGGVMMAIGLGMMSRGPAFGAMLPIWFVVGFGWSLVQTPAGRVVNRSASPSDRPAYFSAQFALSHACWLIFYPVAGQLGTRIGIETTALVLGVAILVFVIVAAAVWPRIDQETLEHGHEKVTHEHLHAHGEHHEHAHDGAEGDEPHSHPHEHPELLHTHQFVIDDHHAIWPDSSTP
jgi:predicted MFS family arabinose efflux permease